MTDVIDQLAGIRPASVDALRRRRPVTRDSCQASFDALFRRVDDTHVHARRARCSSPRSRRVDCTTTRPRTSTPTARAADAERRCARRRDRRGRPPRAHRPVRSALPRRRALAAESTDGPRYAPTPRGATRSASGSPRRSSTRTCWCSARARRRPRPSTGCRAGWSDRRHRHAVAARGVPGVPAARRRRAARCSPRTTAA